MREVDWHELGAKAAGHVDDSLGAAMTEAFVP